MNGKRKLHSVKGSGLKDKLPRHPLQDDVDALMKKTGGKPLHYFPRFLSNDYTVLETENAPATVFAGARLSREPVVSERR